MEPPVGVRAESERQHVGEPGVVERRGRPAELPREVLASGRQPPALLQAIARVAALGQIQKAPDGRERQEDEPTEHERVEPEACHSNQQRRRHREDQQSRRNEFDAERAEVRETAAVIDRPEQSGQVEHQDKASRHQPSQDIQRAGDAAEREERHAGNGEHRRPCPVDCRRGICRLVDESLERRADLGDGIEPRFPVVRFDLRGARGIPVDEQRLHERGLVSLE
jgi:hypothetical protein